MPIEFTDMTFMLAVLTGLTGLVSVITEVIKLNTKKVSPILISTIVGIVVVLCATVCYCMIKGIAITFPIIFVGFCGSFIVILSANYGFDKVKQYFVGVQAQKEAKSGKSE